MPVIALVAAGARLGLSLGKVFGRHGFDVVLIARSKERLGGLTGELAAVGVAAAGFAADVTDRSALTAALGSAAGRFGGIDVLHYSSPGAGTTEALRRTGALDVTVENLRPQVECICYGAITATRAVLPAMLDARTGTLLYTTGGSSVTPAPVFVSAGMAAGGSAQLGSSTSTAHWPEGASTPATSRSAHGSPARQAPPKAPRSRNPTTLHASTGTSTSAASPPNTSSAPDPAVHAAQRHPKLWPGTGNSSRNRPSDRRGGRPLRFGATADHLGPSTGSRSVTRPPACRLCLRGSVGPGGRPQWSEDERPVWATSPGQN